MKETPLRLRNYSITDFQRLNSQIYGSANDRYFETWRLIARLQMFVGRTLTALRTEENTECRVRYYMPMAFSWSMALVNRFHVEDLEGEIWKRFPGVCRYCGGRPCLGQGRCKKEMTKACPIEKPATLFGYQLMFGDIYPHNNLDTAKSHLAEEVCELMEAFEHFCGKDDDGLYEELVGELIDLITFIFAVCNIFKIDLAELMEEQFKNGCPKCLNSSCKCKHWAAKVV